MQLKRLSMEQKATMKENLHSLITVFVFPAVLVIFLFRVLFGVFFIPSPSMEPTLRQGSVQIGWRLPYLVSDPAPDRGDIIVFQNDGAHKLLVKRVIAVGGDELIIKDQAVYLNGEKLQEPYLSDGTVTDGDFIFRVPEGMLLLLGDNRGDSLDARYWQNPYVEIEKAVARVLFHGDTK